MTKCATKIRYFIKGMPLLNSLPNDIKFEKSQNEFENLLNMLNLILINSKLFVESF